MNLCLFVSDLRGNKSRIESLLKYIRKERPEYVFVGGNTFPPHTPDGSQNIEGPDDFITGFMMPKFMELKKIMDCAYPDIFMIPGTDDLREYYDNIKAGEKEDLWYDLHNKRKHFGKYTFYGYGSISATTAEPKEFEKFENTIIQDLEELYAGDDQSYGIWLLHTPAINSGAGMIRNTEGNEAFAGSKAVSQFIHQKQPYITMHASIHESFSSDGKWHYTYGRTHSFFASGTAAETAVIRFELHTPKWAERIVL